MNGLTLAYIGDSYYELKIRLYLTNEVKLTKVDDLHKKAIKFTSSVAQRKIIEYLMNENMLCEDEIDDYKRGRNMSGPGRRNVDAQTYHMATGFESMIGGLYLRHLERCDEVIRHAIKFIEKGDFHGESSEKNNDKF